MNREKKLVAHISVIVGLAAAMSFVLVAALAGFGSSKSSEILDKIDIVQVHPELCLVVAVKNDAMAIAKVDCKLMKEEK